MKKKSFYLTEAGTGIQILVTPCSFDYAATPAKDEMNEANSVVCLCGETFYVTEKLSDIAYQIDNMED